MFKSLNKIVWSIVLILLIVTLYFIFSNKKVKEYSRTFEYMDTYIEVRIYDNNKNKASRVLNDVEDLYKEYSILTDKYKEYEKVNNIYYIHNNKEDKEYIEIDKRLYDLIKYSLDFYEKTDGYFDITLGNVVDLWHDYRTLGLGVPTYEELNSVHLFDKDVILGENNTVFNNHVNIDLGGIAKGYVTNLAKELIEEKDIKSYLINAGGNVVVGDYYKKSGEYKIGLENPDTGGIYEIISGNNISVVTSGSYERFYEVDGVRYSHIISPKTLYPTNFSKSVTVICNDSAYADILSTYLFLIPVEDGIKYIESIDGVEAIWYIDGDNIKMTSGFSRYIDE